MNPPRLRAITNRWPLDRGVQRAMRLVRVIQLGRREPNAYVTLEEKQADLRIALNLHHDVHWTMYYFARPLLRATRRSGPFRFILRSLRPNEVFIDIGANFGLFTLQVASRQPLCRILAIEPHPAIAESLARSVEINQLRYVSVLRAALADERGERDLFVDKRNFGGHALRRRAASAPTPIRVPIETFDHALEEANIDGGQSVRVVKIDVEGAEPQIIAGMSGFLHQGHRPRIVCEVRGPRPRRGRAETPFSKTTAGQVIAQLDGFGYRPHAITPDGSTRPVAHERIRGVQDIAMLPD